MLSNGSHSCGMQDSLYAHAKHRTDVFNEVTQCFLCILGRLRRAVAVIRGLCICKHSKMLIGIGHHDMIYERHFMAFGFSSSSS